MTLIRHSLHPNVRSKTWKWTASCSAEFLANNSCYATFAASQPPDPLLPKIDGTLGSTALLKESGAGFQGGSTETLPSPSYALITYCETRFSADCLTIVLSNDTQEMTLLV